MVLVSKHKELAEDAWAKRAVCGDAGELDEI